MWTILMNEKYEEIFITNTCGIDMPNGHKRVICGVHTMTHNWNLDDESACSVEINGVQIQTKLPLINPCENGISYVRFRSTSVWPDKDGFLVESVNAEVD